MLRPITLVAGRAGGAVASWLGGLVTRWSARPAARDRDDAWADDIVGWVDEMRQMEGTRSIRRPLPYPISGTADIGSTTA